MTFKMAEFPTFKGSWPWIGSYCIGMHHSSTSTYIGLPIFIEIEETLCGRKDIFLPIYVLGGLGGDDLKTKVK